ncbi:MAG: hypothetical protein ACXQTM_03270 [Methanosarcinales archaeon]
MIGERCCVFSPDFEEVLRQCDSHYAVIESEASEVNDDLGLELGR